MRRRPVASDSGSADRIIWPSRHGGTAMRDAPVFAGDAKPGRKLLKSLGPDAKLALKRR